MSENQYHGYSSGLAHKLWHNERPSFILNEELGFPILVCDEDGEYIPFDGPFERTPASPTLINQVREQDCVALENKPGLAGIGVFALEDIDKDQLIGPYGGTVLTLEEADELPDEASHFLFAIRSGAQGVVLDGHTGKTPLKFINHSCSPNAIMRERFVDNCWHVLVWALRPIRKGEEITHDFQLTTENDEDPDLRTPCLCGSATCRQTLWSLRRF